MKSILLSGVCLVLIPGSLQAAEPRWNNLLEQNPFAGPPPASPPVPLPRYELRSVVDEGGARYFSLHDSATKGSVWLRLQEAKDGMKAARYDEKQRTLTLEFSGQVVNLTLLEPAFRATPSPQKLLASTKPTSSKAPLRQNTTLDIEDEERNRL